MLHKMPSYAAQDAISYCSRCHLMLHEMPSCVTDDSNLHWTGLYDTLCRMGFPDCEDKHIKRETPISGTKKKPEMGVTKQCQPSMLFSFCSRSRICFRIGTKSQIQANVKRRSCFPNLLKFCHILNS